MVTKLMKSKTNFLIREAQKTAKKLLSSDKKILPIRKWGDGETLFVSQDDELVSSVDVFVTDDGLQFFIGTKK